jgi:hypothetical protein
LVNRLKANAKSYLNSPDYFSALALLQMEVVMLSELIVHELPGPPVVPEPKRPYVEGYGIPEHNEGLLRWEYVCERMAKSRNYWVCTVGKNGRPHSVPVWGIWYNQTLFFGGGPNTRWSRNLVANPTVSIHLEDGNEAIIFEGTVARITDAAVMAPIDDEYLVKYNMRHGPPVGILKPRLALAWTEYPTTTTRWLFDQA